MLRSPGQPLDRGSRELFEPRFGHDFSSVRVHTGEQAAQSAAAVNAHAYTVGSHIVLGKAAVRSSLDERRLLAHELTHVVQQTRSVTHHAGTIEIQPPGTHAEREADQFAEHPDLRNTSKPRVGETGFGLQRLLCDSILDAEEGERVSGNEAERQIRTDFIMQAGFNFARFPIPIGSSKPYRTECGGSEKQIDPQVIGGQAGLGIPDLSYISGKTLELAEIKIGTWPCLHFAEDQVKNYVDKGKSPENKKWRQQHGIDDFTLMPTSRFTPRDVTIDQTPVSVGWCEPGVIVYKPKRKSNNEETFLCGAISDRGVIDKFLDRAMDKAEQSVDKYLDGTIDRMIDEAIQKELTDRHLGITADAVRIVISSLKARLMARLRQAMKAQLRKYLQESLVRLCATAAAKGVVSLQDLLKKLEREMGPLILVPALVLVTQELAKEAAEVVLDVVKKVALAIIIAVLAIVAALLLRGMKAPPEGVPEGFGPPITAQRDPSEEGDARKGIKAETPAAAMT